MKSRLHLLVAALILFISLSTSRLSVYASGSVSCLTHSSALILGTFGAGTDIQNAESFLLTGYLTDFQLYFGSPGGSPSGTVTWYVSAASPSGSPLFGGTFTPVSSGLQTITVNSNYLLQSGTTYYIVFKSTNVQATMNYWTQGSSATSSCANGNLAETSNGGGTWTEFPTQDLYLAATAIDATQTPYILTATPTYTLTPTITPTPSITPTPTNTPTPTPNLYSFLTLPSPASGRAGAVLYQVDAGEAAIGSILAMVIAVLLFLMFLYMRSSQ